MKKLKKLLLHIYAKAQKAYSYIKLIQILITFVNFIQKYRTKFYLSNLYTDCFEITLKTYINIVVNNDFKGLRKRFIYIPKRFYYEAFKQIQEQHIDITENQQVKNEKNNKNRLDKLSKKKFDLICFYFILKNKDSEFVISELKKRGYSGKNKEAIIKKIEAGVKMLNMELNILNSNKQEENYTKQTKKDFYDTLTILSKNGYDVSDNMSYGHYIITINTFNKEIETIQNAKRNRPN